MQKNQITTQTEQKSQDRRYVRIAMFAQFHPILKQLAAKEGRSVAGEIGALINFYLQHSGVQPAQTLTPSTASVPQPQPRFQTLKEEREAIWAERDRQAEEARVAEAKRKREAFPEVYREWKETPDVLHDMQLLNEMLLEEKDGGLPEGHRDRNLVLREIQYLIEHKDQVGGPYDRETGMPPVTINRGDTDDTDDTDY